MTDLFIYDRKIKSVFQLLGQNENDISYSVGYVLSQSPAFLQNFLAEAGLTHNFDPKSIKINLQRYGNDRGFTDFEIIQEGVFHIIVEAKRGWVFPAKSQLEKYSSRFSETTPLKKLIVFNESIPAFTETHFGYAVEMKFNAHVISWQRMRILAEKAIRGRQIYINQLLRQLIIYLMDISTMQKKDSNRVFVVSLGSGTVPYWNISWQDIVNKKGVYFHPVGGGTGGWPKEPPNYIAFRYNGKLQSIHHIDSYEVFTDPNTHVSEIPTESWTPHYLYRLGKPIRPLHEVRTGKKIVRSARVWAALDLLLTCETIDEAREKTRQRV